MISDAGEVGDLVLEGLLGEAAVCLDIDAWEEALLEQVECRLDEAYAFASWKNA